MRKIDYLSDDLEDVGFSDSESHVEGGLQEVSTSYVEGGDGQNLVGLGMVADKLNALGRSYRVLMNDIQRNLILYKYLLYLLSNWFSFTSILLHSRSEPVAVRWLEKFVGVVIGRRLFRCMGVARLGRHPVSYMHRIRAGRCLGNALTSG